MRVFVWASVILLPIALLVDVTLAGTKSSSKTAAGLSAAASGETAARLAIETWAAQSPSPLPGAHIVDWLGAASVTVSTPPKGSPAAGSARYRAVIDRFGVTAGGRLYQVDVEVALGANGSAAPIGEPSIEPGPPGMSSPASSGPWPGIQATSSVSSAVTQAIQGWAQAYTSGSSSELHLAVGDPSGADTYRPLSGVASVSTSIPWAAPIGPARSGEMIAQVDLAITWDHSGSRSAGVSGTSGVSGVSGNSGTPTPSALDVLVERANSAAPVVVAWGPPGSGPTLTPYSNAVHG
jgi:hypothetical protein